LDSELDSTPLEEEQEAEEHGKGTMAHWIKRYTIETPRQLSAEMATDQKRSLADSKLNIFSMEVKECAKKTGKKAKQPQGRLSCYQNNSLYLIPPVMLPLQIQAA